MITQPTSSLIRWHQLAAIFIALFAFFMSGFISERVFERLPHLEDEMAYLYQARIFAGGQIVVDSPQPTGAFWQPFVLDSAETGKRFGKYTPGWPAILALGVAMGYPQSINAFFSVLTVVLVYRLGREVFNPDVGVLAALLVAFSPAALLLNGTLMSHAMGLFFTTLFIYAYWRLEKNKRPYRWALVAGVSLGILAATRPLTTLGVGLPFIAWSAVRLLMALIAPPAANQRLQHTFSILRPLLVLSAATLMLASSIPLFSYAATGDPTQNLYELVWDYDRIGFGECCGRNFHRLEKAINHARFDLSLTAADLFGWQFSLVTDDMIAHFQLESDYYEGTGYSFYLLPLGILLGLGLFARQIKWPHLVLMLIWIVVALFWVWFPHNLDHPLLNLDPELTSNVTFSWMWVILALLWLFIPLVLWHHYQPQMRYTWLLAAIVGSVVIVQMLYWIGSQRYSTRYYYEALTAAALLTALPIASLIRLGRDKLATSTQKRKHTLAPHLIWQGITYSMCLIFCVFTLLNYSLPRIQALYRFNGISPDLIEAVQAQATNDQPILVIINGTLTGEDRIRWRSYAPLMAVTSPYLNSEIIAARISGPAREQLIATFPDRQVIEVLAIGNDATVQQDRP